MALRRPIQGFDLAHQVWRLRHSKNMSDREVELVMRTIMEHVQTYEQVVEVQFPTSHRPRLKFSPSFWLIFQPMPVD
jgi:hypothetical protein